MPEKNYTGLEERTAKVEGILEQIDKRLDRVEVGLVDLKNEFKVDISKLENKVHGLSNEMRSNFKWLIGIIVGTWITTISALITAILTIIFKG